MAIALPYTLKMSAAIRCEWRVRCIADVIPELDGECWDVPRFACTLETVRQVRDDCAFMSDPKCVDATAGERAAYRALMRQCDAIIQGAGK